MYRPKQAQSIPTPLLEILSLFLSLCYSTSPVGYPG